LLSSPQYLAALHKSVALKLLYGTTNVPANSLMGSPVITCLSMHQRDAIRYPLCANSAEGTKLP